MIIPTNLIWPDARILLNIRIADSETIFNSLHAIVLESNNFQAQRTCVKQLKWPLKVTQGHVFWGQWKADVGLHVAI